MASAASWVEGPDAALRWMERQRAERVVNLGWLYPGTPFAPATIRDPRFAAFWARLKVVPPPGV